MPSTSLRASRLTAVAAASGATNWLNRATWKLFDGNTLSPLVQSGATSMGWLFDSTGTLRARPHNLLLQSEALENATWVKGQSTIAAVFQTAPNGTNTARKLVENTASSVHAVYPGNYVITGARLTASVYLKAAERTFVTLEISNFSTGGALCRFNLTNGTAGGASSTTSDYTGVTAAIENVGNGWYRCSISAVKGVAVNSNNRFVINLDTGTSINYQGDGVSGVLVWGAQLNQGELQPYYRTGTYNLLQFTEAFENAVWTASNVTVQSNVATSVDGGLTADRLVESATASAKLLSWTQATVAGSVYTISLFAKEDPTSAKRFLSIYANSGFTGSASYGCTFDLAAGTVVRQQNGFVGSVTPVGNGWFRCSVVTTAATGTSAGMRIAISNSTTGVIPQSYTGDGTSGIFIDRAQLVQGSDPLPYEPILGTTPTPAAYYGPRVSYDPANLSLGPFLLAEEARTNSIRNNTMQGAVAGLIGSGGAMPTNWSAAGIPGTLTRTVVGVGVESGVTYVDIRFAGTTSSGGTGWYYDAANQVPAIVGNVFSHSVFVSVVGGSLNNINAVNLNTLERSSTGTGLITRTTTVAPTSALRRYIQVSTFTFADVAFAQPGISLGFTAGVPIDITLRIGLPQLEQGATASSPILTFGAAVTRSADSLSVTNLAATGFNATEGTIYCDYQNAAEQSAFRYPIFINDGTTSNFVGINAGGGGGSATQHGFRVNSGGGLQAGMNLGAQAANRSRVAGRYALNDFAASLNGASPLLDTSGALPLALTTINFGSQQAGVNPFSVRIYQAAIIPQRVPDSGLQRLTRV